MYKNVLVSFLLFLPVFAFCQNFSPVSDISGFQSKLAVANSSRKTIQSSFVQTKHLTLLSDKLMSYGSFSYMAPDKVRVSYEKPFIYLFVMNHGMMMVKDESKASKINTKGNPLLQSLNDILVDCMTGQVMNNKDFKIEVGQSGSIYQLKMIPVTASMKKMFDQIYVYLSATKMDVTKINMIEPNGDKTEMVFSNTKTNVPLNESLFKVR